MRRVKLNAIQANALEKIARRSKMDCWFSIKWANDEISVKESDVNTLFDGSTEYDIESLSTVEVLNLFSLLLKCNKIRK